MAESDILNAHTATSNRVKKFGYKTVLFGNYLRYARYVGFGILYTIEIATQSLSNPIQEMSLT